MFKVERYKGEAYRNRNSRLSQHRPLPLLCRRKIHLKHAQFGNWIPIGECVEPRAQDNVLPNSLLTQLGELVLGKSATRCHERTKRPGHRMALSFMIDRKIPAQQGHGNRIIQNAWLIEDLMDCAAMRHT